MITFYRFWPSAPTPIKPSSSLNGEISARALRFCEPFLVANRLGWLIFSPIDFNLIWDGERHLLQFEGDERWIIIDRIFLPNMAKLWNDRFPGELNRMMPIFLESFPERGVLQLWTGFYVQTVVGQNLLVRSAINQQYSNSYRVIEGVLETDWWAGPLFTVIEVLKTDVPITFRKNKPFLQIITLPKQLCDPVGEKTVKVVELEGHIPRDYLQRIKNTSVRRNTSKPGSYRRQSKKIKNNG